MLSCRRLNQSCRHRGDIDGAAMGYEHLVADDADQGVCDLHDERSGSEIGDLLAVRKETSFFIFRKVNAELISGTSQEIDRKQHGQQLRDDGSDRGSFHSHMECEDEEGIEEQVSTAPTVTVTMP